MEAPEKLYLSQIIYGTFQYQVPDPDDDTQVEYIRKDAFIEKILKYLDVNFYFHDSRYRIECAVFDSKEEMIENFKKYIEDII